MCILSIPNKLIYLEIVFIYIYQLGTSWRAYAEGKGLLVVFTHSLGLACIFWSYTCKDDRALRACCYIYVYQLSTGAYTWFNNTK